jgi:predicted metal-binding protein
MMSSDSSKAEKKKVAITQETYEILKTYSRLNALKLRLVIDAMVEITLADEVLSKRVFDLALAKEADKSD